MENKYTIKFKKKGNKKWSTLEVSHPYFVYKKVSREELNEVLPEIFEQAEKGTYVTIYKNGKRWRRKTIK